MDNIYKDICINCGYYYEKDSLQDRFIIKCHCGDPYSYKVFPKDKIDPKDNSKIFNKFSMGDFLFIIKQTGDHYSGILRYKDGGSFIISKGFNRQEVEIVGKRILFRFIKNIEEFVK